MRIARRGKAVAFFITLGACLVGAAIALNVSWIILNWREVVPLVLGVVFFGLIIAGVALNTIFLVREIRKNEQQDSFLNAVTHELKTPVASIRLYLETLQSRNLDDERRKDFYRIMLEDTDRLLGTVEQVLRAGEARHGDGNHKSWAEVDIAKLAFETVDLARVRHHLSGEELRFGIAPHDELLVRGNPEELRTAFVNLLDNAVKYSIADKDIVVDVLTPNIDTVLLQVHDKGIGIARHELKKVFKRFYRVHSSGKVKGTGLGLFIVRSIARRHGGDATAESEGEGRGSTFSLRLPRVYHP